MMPTPSPAIPSERPLRGALFDTLLVRVPDVASTVIDNELILMDLRSGKYFCLTGTARRIWQLLAAPVTGEKLCESLCESYEVDGETCRRDVERFLGHLIDRQLVNPQN